MNGGCGCGAVHARALVETEVEAHEARPFPVAALEGFAEDFEEDAPPTAAACARDVAVADDLALLVTTHAPLPVTRGETQRVAGDAGARDDYHSVCAVVPARPDPRLLVFFHGNNNYVTVAPVGDVPARIDPTGFSRAPRWLPPDQRHLARAKPAAPIKYGLRTLVASQRGLPEGEPFTGLAVKDPLVLVPEVAERTDGRFWCVPPRGQYGSHNRLPAGATASTRLSDLVDECHAHLRCLQRPSGGAYLAADAPGPPACTRITVSGHSGGGKPLVEAASATWLGPRTATTGVDLWLLDCTYGGFTTTNYVDWCTRWRDVGRLSRRADGGRLVCVYRPRSSESDTETAADELRAALARLLGVGAATLRKLHDSGDMGAARMVRDVIPALVSMPVVFVRTEVAHDRIPTLFMPLLLRTAAS